jgi:hypothetical protein
MYRIDIGNGDTRSSDYGLSQRTFSTLKEARSALRAHNGGRLYGKYDPPEEGIEGWNLGPQEGCDCAVIVREKENAFDIAYKEFSNLEMVDDDPARTKTVADLVFITQFEIDLVEAGESKIDVRPHRRFVKKWADASGLGELR